MAHRLNAFVVPGPDVARAHGLDLEDAGLRIVDTPRHASVLLLVDELPDGLMKAATVAYAQMMRPRAVFAVGAGAVSSLPESDVSVTLDQESVVAGVEELRHVFVESAFDPDAEDFESEVVREDEEDAGGMDHGHDHGHMHHDHGEEDHGEEDEGEQGDEQETDESEENQAEAEEKEIGEDQLENFMSMIEMTEGMPASGDGLIMEWAPAPYGPLFPGLPGGLSLTFTLDGDTVAEAEVEPGIEGHSPLDILHGPIESLPERAAKLDPLTPVAYRLLVQRAVESVADKGISQEEALSRIAALERERAASHLGWTASFGYLIGDGWLSQRGARLQLALLRAENSGEIKRIKDDVESFIRKALKTPLLGSKLGEIGALDGNAESASGPVARAAGIESDARSEDPAYRNLGFSSIVKDGNDALTRFQLRLEEIDQSLDLVLEAEAITDGDSSTNDASSGTDTATVETPRGTATLRVTLEEGTVTTAELDAPSMRNVQLVETVTVDKEVADALVGVGSLDLSPWEMSG
jgi:Ni,Fe-hydrogenase III large subunit